MKCAGTQKVSDALARPASKIEEHREYMWGTRVPGVHVFLHPPPHKGRVKYRRIREVSDGPSDITEKNAQGFRLYRWRRVTVTCVSAFVLFYQ